MLPELAACNETWGLHLKPSCFIKVPVPAARLRKCFFAFGFCKFIRLCVIHLPSPLISCLGFFFFSLSVSQLLGFESPVRCPHILRERKQADERQWEITWPHLIHRRCINEFLVISAVLFWLVDEIQFAATSKRQQYYCSLLLEEVQQNMTIPCKPSVWLQRYQRRLIFERSWDLQTTCHKHYTLWKTSWESRALTCFILIRAGIREDNFVRNASLLPQKQRLVVSTCFLGSLWGLPWQIPTSAGSFLFPVALQLHDWLLPLS